MIASTQTNHPIAGVNGAEGARPIPDPLVYSKARLKAAGLRITQPRLAILAELARQPQPVSTEAIHALLGSDTCDLVTVYRCLSAFEEIGLVRRSFRPSGTAHYEINLGQPARYRILCKATNEATDLDEAASAELRRSLHKIEEQLRARGYEDVGHFAEFFGRPPSGPQPDQPGRASGPKA